MHTLTIIDGLSSELSPEFAGVTELEVVLREEGNFGDLYDLLSAGGVPTGQKYLVKLFKDNGFGSEIQCFTTVRKLQQRILEADRKFQAHGEPGIESFPALAALPQHSFLGELNGGQVKGYVMKRLDTAGYVSFAAIQDDPDLRSEYGKLSLDDRLFLCYELCEGFRILVSEMSFIHADVNPPNFFVNIAECHLALIDYDSGAVTEGPDDKPGTFGKATYGEWLAPEILDQILAQKKARGNAPLTVTVDLFTDTWAVLIAMHHLLFLCHPLFFLVRLSSQVIRDYLANQRWPAIDASDHLFNPDVEADQHAFYLDQLRELPPLVVQKLASSINQGYSNSQQRASYYQWSRILKLTQPVPEIEFFTADRRGTLQGLPVQLSWSVKGTRQVVLEPGIGAVDAQGSLQVFPRADQSYDLVATARNGLSVREVVLVRVFVPPEIRALRVPTPRMSLALQMGAIRLPAPRLSLPIQVNLGVRLNAASLAGTTSPNASGQAARSFPVQVILSMGDVFRNLKTKIQQLVGGTQ